MSLRVARMCRYIGYTLVETWIYAIKTGTTHAVKPPVLSLDLGRTSDTHPYLWRERSGRDTKNPKKKTKQKQCKLVTRKLITFRRPLPSLSQCLTGG